eukprot:TRINITY_DN8941_c0_g1_i10.p2 TRINITY_DN8941_c0_g1~~TRINITY_DN8941_c0_g1_i10.p2  ORF type:complete len:440 (+),score=24.44 TRINITY_DN8941_c0_g1_i10:835-2154(+)
MHTHTHTHKHTHMVTLPHCHTARSPPRLPLAPTRYARLLYILAPSSPPTPPPPWACPLLCYIDVTVRQRSQSALSANMQQHIDATRSQALAQESMTLASSAGDLGYTLRLQQQPGAASGAGSGLSSSATLMVPGQGVSSTDWEWMPRATSTGALSVHSDLTSSHSTLSQHSDFPELYQTLEASESEAEGDSMSGRIAAMRGERISAEQALANLNDLFQAKQIASPGVTSAGGAGQSGQVQGRAESLENDLDVAPPESLLPPGGLGDDAGMGMGVRAGVGDDVIVMAPDAMALNQVVAAPEGDPLTEDLAGLYDSNGRTTMLFDSQSGHHRGLLDSGQMDTDLLSQLIDAQSAYPGNTGPPPAPLSSDTSLPELPVAHPVPPAPSGQPVMPFPMATDPNIDMALLIAQQRRAMMEASYGTVAPDVQTNQSQLRSQTPPPQ